MWAGKCPSGGEDEAQCGPGALAQVGAKHAEISVMVAESREFWEQVRSGCVSDLGHRAGPSGWEKARGQQFNTQDLTGMVTAGVTLANVVF